MGFISSALESTLDFLCLRRAVIELIEELLVTRKDNQWSHDLVV